MTSWILCVSSSFDANTTYKHLPQHKNLHFLLCLQRHPLRPIQLCPERCEQSNQFGLSVANFVALEIDDAYLSRRKIKSYLLSRIHPSEFFSEE